MGFTKVTASGINTEGYFSLENINSIGIITTTEINVGSAVTLSGSGINVTGVITATSFSGDGSNLSNTGSTLSAASGSQRLVLTSQTSGTMTASSTDSDLTYNASTDTLSVTNFSASGNVSIAGTLTYEDVTNVDSIGLITARSGVKIQTGSASTALVVEGDARVTGILTIGTSSISLDGTNNQINVGTGITLHHSNGVQVGSNTLHSTGFTVNNINSTGVITATSFSGDGSNITGLTRTLTIGVRTGAALTTNLTGSSFNVYDRDTNPISISI